MAPIMADGNRLKLRDVRNVFRLIGEIRELGADPAAVAAAHGARRLQQDAELPTWSSRSEIHFRKQDGQGRDAGDRHRLGLRAGRRHVRHLHRARRTSSRRTTGSHAGREKRRPAPDAPDGGDTRARPRAPGASRCTAGRASSSRSTRCRTSAPSTSSACTATERRAAVHARRAPARPPAPRRARPAVAAGRAPQKAKDPTKRPAAAADADAQRAARRQPARSRSR